MQPGISVPTVFTAFTAGLLSFLSPCVLPLVPAYLSYMSGVSVEELASAKSADALKRTGIKSIVFVLGFSTVFIAMGATATSIGTLLAKKMAVLMSVAGIIIFVFGLHMTGIIRIKSLYSEKRFHLRLKNVGYAGAYVIGVMFALGWTPCIGPVLAAILGLAANSKTVGLGITLLAVYSLGLGIPFILAGFATGAALRALSGFKRHFRKIEIASGVLLMVVGFLIFTGNLSAVASWMSNRH